MPYFGLTHIKAEIWRGLSNHKEILAIQNFKNEYCILIDDVRAFLFPPQPPFDYKKWPTISKILRTLDLKKEDLILLLMMF